MSKKILLILASILSFSFTITPRSIKFPKPHQYLLNAIKASSFLEFRNAIKHYYTNKAQLPDNNTEQLSKKTIFAMYNTFPLIKQGIAKANRKQLKYLHILQRQALDKMQVVKGLTVSALATYLTYYMFKLARKVYHDYSYYQCYKYYSIYDISADITLFAITYAAILGLYKYGYNKICDGTVNYKEYINKKIKENELISDYIESH